MDVLWVSSRRSGTWLGNIEGRETAAWNVHLRVLLCVHHSCNGNTEVGDGAPEVCTMALLAIGRFKKYKLPVSIQCKVPVAPALNFPPRHC